VVKNTKSIGIKLHLMKEMNMKQEIKEPLQNLSWTGLTRKTK